MIQINTNHPHWGQLSRLFTQNQKCQTHGGTIGHFLPWESWMSEQNFMTIHLIVETFQSSFTTQTSVLPIPPIFFLFQYWLRVSHSAYILYLLLPPLFELYYTYRVKYSHPSYILELRWFIEWKTVHCFVHVSLDLACRRHLIFLASWLQFKIKVCESE